MKYCKKCMYPEVSVNLMLDDDGICSACHVQDEFNNLTDDFWNKRKQKFEEIIDKYRSKNQSNYDCIIPVSGGKDSYYQTYMIKEVYKLNPLLVTYHGNNYMEEGQENLDNMREVFGVDHIVFGPSVATLKKLNRLCFKKLGDMNWHAHCGIETYPIQIAVKMKIPIIVWGETAWDVSGMHSPDDYTEFNARSRLEHSMRGYDWYDMIDEEEGIKEKHLLWAKYPSDEEIESVGVRGIYLGNYFKWDPNVHSTKMRAKYGFQGAKQPFERTYRQFSNLDDMHENGVHDYLKFIKFGYGRASDHASKDIRAGYMSREEGIKMVKKYDHVKPRRDLKRWLEYVGMSEEEFDKIADSFRDKRVWSKDSSGNWVKDNIWDFDK
jgi:N-acetyl sugar amidotransferase